MPRLTPDELAEIRKLASADFNGHLVIRLLDEYEKLADQSKLEDVPAVAPWDCGTWGNRGGSGLRGDPQ